jgi:plastocyanin
MVKRMAWVAALAAALFAMVPAGPAGAGGGGCHAQEATSARALRIALEGNCFTPTLARVPVGATVTWINSDPYTHTVTGSNGAWGSYDELVQNATVKMRFARAGVYPYFCMIHPGMVGAVLVGDANGPGTAHVIAGSSIVEPADTEPVAKPAVPVATKAPARSSAAWPAVASALSAAMGLAGFGVGRRSRSGPGFIAGTTRTGQ